MTENRTPELSLRIRLTSLPNRDGFDAFDLDCYHVGQVYVLPSRLATLLILGGHAELVEPRGARAEAADWGQPRFPRRK